MYITHSLPVLLTLDEYSYITLEDMKGLLGTAGDAEDESLSKMWEDGLVECVCPLGTISYDDFRMFIKGQRRDKEPTSPAPRKSSKRLTLEGSPLQAVPEGSMSPQAKQQVFGKFHEMYALDSLKMPVLGAPLIPKDESHDDDKMNISLPNDLTQAPQTRIRSRSLGEAPAGEEWWREDVETETRARGHRSSVIVSPSRAICDLQYVIKDESKTAREVHKALYRKHREFRQSVMHASKLFDLKQRARKFEVAQVPPEHRSDHMQKRASLVMRRGASQPKGGDLISANSEHLPNSSSKEPEPEHAAPQPSVETSLDSEHLKRVADAARRSGRPRPPRQKTKSDISGMLR